LSLMQLPNATHSAIMKDLTKKKENFRIPSDWVFKGYTSSPDTLQMNKLRALIVTRRMEMKSVEQEIQAPSTTLNRKDEAIARHSFLETDLRKLKRILDSLQFGP
jgi:hypothetical protein